MNFDSFFNTLLSTVEEMTNNLERDTKAITDLDTKLRAKTAIKNCKAFHSALVLSKFHIEDNFKKALA